MIENESAGPMKRLFRTLGVFIADRRCRRRLRWEERRSHADMKALSAHTKRDIGWHDR